MKTVDISWNEKRKVIYNRHTGEYLLDNTDDELLDQSGFYCIYGHHPLYGSDVLLYIGETKEGRDGNRTFRHRLKEHFRGRFWHHQNLWFSTGTSDSSLSEHEVQVVESILIATHKPALNRKHLDVPMKDAGDYYIRNWEFSGALHYECSGNYWLE